MTPSLIPAGISLRELLASDVVAICGPDVRAASCTHDWRQVRPGDVFVAIDDAETDGHLAAAHAVQAGAVAVICERTLPVFNVSQFVVNDSRLAYGRLCQALVGNPSEQLKLIGVTGTSGKTTVCRLITAIFREAGFQAGALDSYGYSDGYEERPTSSAQLSAPLLARSLGQMSAGGVSHAVVEISSRDLSEGLLAGVDLDAVCITNVQRDHLKLHASVESYRQATRRVFDHLNADGVAVLNADDPASVDMLCDVSQPMLTFALQKPAEITADLIERHVNEQTFVLTAGDESVGVRTAIIGDHHMYNCLSAAATCLAYGIDLSTIARGLEAVDRLPGRMELVRCGQEFTVFVDAADSPDTLRAALRTAREVTSGRLICVFGPAAECEYRTSRAVSRVLEVMADVVVRTTDGRSNRDDLYNCAADPRQAHVISSRMDAIRWALQEARAGDTVVIAGLGDGPNGVVDVEGLALSDGALVEQVLRGGFASVALFPTAA